MLVEVDWTDLDDAEHYLWSDTMCLYTYLHPVRDWLFYVGKADYSSVRTRLRGAHKAQLFEDIWAKYRVNEVRVLHGRIILEEGRRRSSEILADVESLLINRLQPFGNIQSRRQRISRRGMWVECRGEWPFRRWRFHDKG